MRRIRQVLRAGGRLAFETRNPTNEPWQAWTPETSRITQLPDGPLETWYEVQAVHDGIVDHAFCYRFASGERIREEGRLIFRSYDAVVKDLFVVGFNVEAAYGDWDRSPVTDDSPELILVALR